MNGKWFWMILFLVGTSCKEKKQKTIASEDLSITELVSLTSEMKLPILISDTILMRKENDSLSVSQKVVKQILSDSVFMKVYPQTKQLKLFALGKITREKEEFYLLFKSIAGSKRAAYLFHFNQKMQFTDVLKMADNEITAKGKKYGRVDSKLNIALCEDIKLRTGELFTNETVYAMNDSGKFMIVMTNSNEDLRDEIQGNPIDTLPRKQIHSADYTIDQRNLVSVRDGLTAKSMIFFIHVSKQNGECVGELKGEASWEDKNTAIFKDKNSDCEIAFHFSNTSVYIKEVNACGSYRDIACFLDGSFTKKKESKPVKKK